MSEQESKQQPDIPSLANLTDWTLAELGRRLQDSRQRKELPGSMLLKFGTDLIRLREREQTVMDEAGARPLEEILAEAELPLDRKRAIAVEELGRLQEAATSLATYLEEIDAGSQP